MKHSIETVLIGIIRKVTSALVTLGLFGMLIVIGMDRLPTIPSLALTIVVMGMAVWWEFIYEGNKQ